MGVLEFSKPLLSPIIVDFTINETASINVLTRRIKNNRIIWGGWETAPTEPRKGVRLGTPTIKKFLCFTTNGTRTKILDNKIGDA